MMQPVQKLAQTTDLPFHHPNYRLERQCTPTELQDQLDYRPKHPGDECLVGFENALESAPTTQLPNIYKMHFDVMFPS